MLPLYCIIFLLYYFFSFNVNVFHIVFLEVIAGIISCMFYEMPVWLLLKCLFVNLEKKTIMTYDIRVGHAPLFERKGHARVLTSSTASASFWSVLIAVFASTRVIFHM